MTPAEKLALVRRSYAAFSHGLDIDALVPLYHPDCEWSNGPMAAAFGGGTFHGHDGLGVLLTELDDGLEDFAVVMDEAKITRDGALLLRYHAAARLSITQMELSMPSIWQRIEFRDGLIASVAQLDEPPPGWYEAAPLDLPSNGMMAAESTTRDLVEVARQLIDAGNRRDFDAVESFYAPYALLRGAEVGAFEGAAAIRGLYEDIARSYEEVHSEIKEAVDLGNGVGFCVVVFEGRPVGSTGVVTLRSGYVVISGGGLIERQTNYMNIDQARADAERLAQERE